MQANGGDHIELVLFGLLVAVAGLSALARRVGVPYAIALVVGGAALGFVPGIPSVELDPGLVLLVFLPPLLFHAASIASTCAWWPEVTSTSVSPGWVPTKMGGAGALTTSTPDRRPRPSWPFATTPTSDTIRSCPSRPPSAT